MYSCWNDGYWRINNETTIHSDGFINMYMIWMEIDGSINISDNHEYSKQ